MLIINSIKKIFIPFIFEYSLSKRTKIISFQNKKIKNKKIKIENNEIKNILGKIIKFKKLIVSYIAYSTFPKRIISKSK